MVASNTGSAGRRQYQLDEYGFGPACTILNPIVYPNRPVTLESVFCSIARQTPTPLRDQRGRTGDGTGLTEPARCVDLNCASIV